MSRYCNEKASTLKLAICGIAFLLIAEDAFSSTSLNHASRAGRVDRVRALLNQGANPNDGSLQQAAKNEHIPVIRLLLNAGALVDDTENDVYDRIQATALFHAAMVCAPQVMKFLIEYGGANVDKQGGWGAPLHVTSALGCMEGIDILLDAYADIEIKSIWNGHTPLEEAATKGKRATIVQRLLERGANPEVSSEVLAQTTPEIREMIEDFSAVPSASPSVSDRPSSDRFSSGRPSPDDRPPFVSNRPENADRSEDTDLESSTGSCRYTQSPLRVKNNTICVAEVSCSLDSSEKTKKFLTVCLALSNGQCPSADECTN